MLAPCHMSRIQLMRYIQPTTKFESVTGFFKELTGLSACVNHAVILSHGASTGVSVDAGRAILEQARKLPAAATPLFAEANVGACWQASGFLGSSRRVMLLTGCMQAWRRWQRRKGALAASSFRRTQVLHAAPYGRHNL